MLRGRGAVMVVALRLRRRRQGERRDALGRGAGRLWEIDTAV